MKKLIFIFLCAITSLSVYSQSQENIDSVNSKYNRIVRKYEQMKSDEIKKLSSGNYLSRKSSINIKYDTLINKITKTRDNEISILSAQIVKNGEIIAQKEREEEELKRKIDAQNAELQRIKAEKEEAERRKKEAEKYEQNQIKIAKESQELEQAREKEREKAAFDKSDYGQIRKTIKRQFTAWLEKKEFENEQTYEVRVKTSATQEFNKIVETECANSKWGYYNSKFYARLGDYNIDRGTFKIQFEDYKSHLTTFNDYISNLNIKANFKGIFNKTFYIHIPSILAESLKNKFGTNQRNVILVYVLNVDIINNYWTPTKMVFVFPNENNAEAIGDIDEYRNGINIEGDNGKYRLVFASNYSFKPISLTDIKKEFSKNTLNEGIYFYEWQSRESTSQQTDFSMTNLEIQLPFTK